MTFTDYRHDEPKNKTKEYLQRNSQYRALVIKKAALIKGISIPESRKILNNEAYSDFVNYSFDKDRAVRNTLYNMDMADHYVSLFGCDLETAFAVVNVELEDGFTDNCIKDGLTAEEAAVELYAHIANMMIEITENFRVLLEKVERMRGISEM